jgi:hypothetical protein
VKLRIDGDSLRLRLNRSDIEQFRQTGVCTESLRFGSDSRLTYMLETSSELTAMATEYRQDCIRVLVPVAMAQEWVGSDQISLSRDCVDGEAPSLLIEKDFQCLHRDSTNPNYDAEAFPNPSAGDQRRAG